ncbi:replication factor A protein 3 [Panus rudis PR-1116 ss-1]|nr:replication factor A protein 3 [Panus rudis PR-1116 ss-1]
MSSELTSPRVNSARLADYIGRNVRLTCKVLKVSSDSALVEASDGGQVKIIITATPITDTYIEVIGKVEEPGVIKMLNCVNQGNNLNMKLVNSVVELWHNPKFSSMF